jgi:hypothetical protein
MGKGNERSKSNIIEIIITLSKTVFITIRAQFCTASISILKYLF